MNIFVLRKLESRMGVRKELQLDKYANFEPVLPAYVMKQIMQNRSKFSIEKYYDEQHRKMLEKNDEDIFFQGMIGNIIFQQIKC